MAETFDVFTKKFRSQTRKYAYNGDNITFDFDGNNQLLARHTHSPLMPDDILSSEISSDGVSAGMAQNSGEVFYLKDALGSVSTILNSSGGVLQKYDYSVYGKEFSIKDGSGVDITAAPLVATSFSYTGREYEPELGIYYYRARYYDPSIGRFLQQDPGAKMSAITIVNRFAYVGNNPAKFSDPTGRIFGIDDAVFIIGAMIIGGLARDYDRKGKLL